VTVRVKEIMHRGQNWRMMKESHEHQKLDAQTIAWDLPVKADGEVVLTFNVEYTW
jgi:hypothetical protein